MDKLKKIEDLLNKKDFETAHDLMIENEDKFKDNAVYWNLRGYLYTMLGEYNPASVCFSNSLNINNLDWETHYNYAHVSEQLGQYNEAAIHYGMTYKYTSDENIKESIQDVFKEHSTLRKIFLSVANGLKKTFVIISNVKWGIVYQRHHHIARSLAKLGYDVYYIEQPIKSEFPSSTIDKNILNTVSKEFKVVDGVKICPTFEGTFNGEIVASNYEDMIGFIVEGIDKDEPAIIINYNTHIVDFLNNLKKNNKHIIYECVDDNTDLDYAFWGNEKSIYDEQKTISKSEHTITTSTTLYVKNAIVNKNINTSLIRNAVSYEDFIVEEILPLDDLKSIPSPRVCYCGALYNRLDTELLFATARKNPNVSFVIIGFGDENLLANSPKNIYFLGPKKHSELKHYLHNMDIGIIPFKADMRGVAYCDSIKHYEYLACSLPVITTCIPESAVGKPYSYLVSSVDEFTSAIDNALKINIDDNVIFDFVMSNSWLDRASDICLLSDSLHEQKYDFDVNVNSLMQEIIGGCATKDMILTNELVNGSNFESAIGSFESHLKYRDSYIDVTYLNMLLQSKNYEQLEKYFKLSLNIHSNELINKFNSYDKKVVLMLLGYILSSEYYCALEIYKKSPNLMSELLNYCDKLDSIVSKVLKMFSDRYFEKNICTNDFKVILIDRCNSVDSDYMQKICPNPDNLTLISSGKFDDFLNSDMVLNLNQSDNVRIIVPFDDKYVNTIRQLSLKNVNSCFVSSLIDGAVILTKISRDILDSVSKNEYLNTISVYKRNSSDGNVEAILRSVPEHLKDTIKIRLIPENRVYSLEESIITPLLSSVTISGFAVFGNYPKHTYNIELWHGGIGLKTCGLMDKVDKKSGGTIECFNNIDKICLASFMNCVQFTSCFAIPENKYEITGLPRTDLLLNPDSRKNLEKLLGFSFGEKKVIVNMPTFHRSASSRRIEGSSLLSDYFKIPNFDYEKFNDFLEKNNMICISKAHHNEESLMKENNAVANLNNLYFINNSTLEKSGLNLYDVLGGADILITDYSSVYGDFLFMNKPTVFSVYDIEEFRESRGIALEPYDFWTAGPKAKGQSELEYALLNCDSEEYRLRRLDLQKVFYKVIDSKASERVWSIIEDSIKKIKKFSKKISL